MGQTDKSPCKSIFFPYIQSNLLICGILLVCGALKLYSGTCIIAQKAVPKAINSRALTSEKLCINKELPLMHRSLTFHMQDSGQYSVGTEAA